MVTIKIYDNMVVVSVISSVNEMEQVIFNRVEDICNDWSKKTVADGKKIFISRDDILNLYQIIFRISLDFQIIIV